MTALRPLLIGVAIGIVAMLAVQAWRDRQPPAPAEPAPIARELRNETTTVVACKPVMVYRDKVKAELGLPPDVQTNAARQVVAATTIPASDRPHTVSAVADLGTGKVDLFVRVDPLAWLALEHRGDASLSYGFRGGLQRYRIAVRQDVLQIKAAHVGVVGSIDSDGQWFAGVGVRVAW